MKNKTFVLLTALTLLFAPAYSHAGNVQSCLGITAKVTSIIARFFNRVNEVVNNDNNNQNQTNHQNIINRFTNNNINNQNRHNNR